MGYARIVSGGPDGRYTIDLDYGQAQKDALQAASSALLAQLDASIAALAVDLAASDAKETAQREKVLAAQQLVIEQSAGYLPTGSPRPDTSAFKFELLQLGRLQSQHAPLRLKMDALKFDRTRALASAAYWAGVQSTETRDVWCADLTEDAAPGSLVATLEMPGDSNLILLAPGCRPPNSADGALMARELMSPAQAFFNAAIFPGWQKFLPTYRWGTATAVNRAANTMNVALAPAISSAQGLSVNQAGALTGVPVTYLACGAAAFEVGDRVVVKFEGQNWESPRVIGFLDNPKPCGWICIAANTIVTLDTDLIFRLLNNEIIVQAKFNGSEWVNMPILTENTIPGIQWTYFLEVTEDEDIIVDFGRGPDIGGKQIGVINVSVSPAGSGRNLAEIRVVIADATEFNAAFLDTGFAGGRVPFSIKLKGIINTSLYLTEFPNFRDVIPLDYELTG